MEVVRVSRVCSEVVKTERMASELVLAQDDKREPEQYGRDFATDATGKIGTAEV